MDIIIYLSIGIFAGLLSGLLGIGGGIIIVPLLVMILHHNPLFLHADIMHIAVGTSLAIIVVTSLSAALAYHRRRALIWPIFWRMIPGICIGIFIGSVITKQLTNTLLTQLFSIFLIIIALHLLIETWRTPKNMNPRELSNEPQQYPIQHQVLMIGASFLVGVLSALFGIGGGILLVPLFLMAHVPMRSATGTATICGAVTAIVGTLILSHLEWPATSKHITGIHSVIYWPAVITIASTSIICAPLGTALAYKLPTILLKRIFAVILLLSAWNLMSAST